MFTCVWCFPFRQLRPGNTNMLFLANTDWSGGEEVLNRISSRWQSWALLTRNVFARLQVAVGQVIDLLCVRSEMVRLVDDQTENSFSLSEATSPPHLTSPLIIYGKENFPDWVIISPERRPCCCQTEVRWLHLCPGGFVHQRSFSRSWLPSWVPGMARCTQDGSGWLDLVSTASCHHMYLMDVHRIICWLLRHVRTVWILEW